MSLSKRAKRGIGLFSRLQWSKTREKYMYHRRKVMLDVNANAYAPQVLDAAAEAMGKLIQNTEAHNAELQRVPNEQNDPQPENPEVGSEQSVSEQPEAGGNAPEGAEGNFLHGGDAQ